jgi:hypothetical protein
MRNILNWWRWNWPSWEEKIILAIVWRLPRKIVYWSAIRVSTYNFTGHPDERTVSQMLKEWDKPKRREIWMEIEPVKTDAMNA